MSDNTFSFDVEAAGDADDEYGFQGYTGRSSFSFLIEGSRPMFAAGKKNEDDDDGDGSSYFTKGVNAVLQFMKAKCSTNSPDFIGVTFLGTKDMKNRLSDDLLPHVYVFQDLQEPNAERVLELEDLLEDDVKANFCDNFGGHSEDYDLRGALWNAVQDLDAVSYSSQYNRGSKKIFLMTCNDNPHKGNAQERNNLLTQISDWRYRNIDIEAITFGDKFDYSKIYKDIINVDNDEDFAPDPMAVLDELGSGVRVKDYKKRASASIKWSLGPGLDISVNLFHTLLFTRKPGAVNLYRETNEQILTNTTTVLAEDGRILLPAETRKYQVYGGQRITMEKEEIELIKHFEAPGLKLIGFKPIERLTERKPHYHVKPAMFIYPDDGWIRGSSNLFGGLLNRCLAKGKMAICRLTIRKNTPPRLVALVPQAEEKIKSETNPDKAEQLTPPGFHVVFLPFADDVRKLSVPKPPLVEEEHLAAAKKLIDAMTPKKRFTPNLFQNPALQKHYRAVEAMALEKSEFEEFPDNTERMIDIISKRAMKEGQLFKDTVFGKGYEPKKKVGAAKKAKVDDSEDIDLKSFVDRNALGSLTVAKLKGGAAQNGINLPRTATKKADIIEAILKHFGKA